MDLRTHHSDPLARLTEDELAHGPLPIESEVGSDLFDRQWWLHFHNSRRYDWADPAWNAQNVGRYAFKPIELTQGYFMIGSLHDYERVTLWPDGSKMYWRAKIDRDSEGNILGVYAKRTGRGEEPPSVYAHRALANALFNAGVVDHFNGRGLDNRRGTPEEPVNLRSVTRSENGHNTVRDRPRNPGLPRGVEETGSGFRGMYCKRSGKRVKTFRSPPFATAQEAADWYVAEMEKLHQQRTAWAHKPTSVNYPIFPPLLSDTLRLAVDNDIPF